MTKPNIDTATIISNIETEIRTETIKEVIEMLNHLPTGHTPDGKHHWVSMEDLDKLKSELEKL